MRDINRILLSLFLLGASPTAEASTTLPGLEALVEVTRDSNGIPHVFAGNDHDLYFMQGWFHAQDRFFQMDLFRRQASGTLAELLGTGALGSDVEARVIGLRRAAERSWPILSKPVQKALVAYQDGVNAFVETNPLPPEYTPLELGQAEPWSVIDSLVIGKALAFGLSFDLDIENTVALQSYQVALGFEVGTALFFEDLFRSAPFDPASTVPDAGEPLPLSLAQAETGRYAAHLAAGIRPKALELGKRYMERVQGLPMFQGALMPDERSLGSNEWVIGGQHSETGAPLLANDPHLMLDFPATFYQVHLVSPKTNVIGSGPPGIPFVLLGHNRDIAWGLTNNRLDVTDTFLEEIVVLDPGPPLELAIIHQGLLEPATRFTETFRANFGGGIVAPVPALDRDVYFVPRRNNGPIIEVTIDPTTGTGSALSVQYTGWSGTRELEAIFRANRANDLKDLERALHFFDFGSQNWAYADMDGNIAYFTSGELPLREDLQAGTVTGLPPFFIRNGTGGNEWLPVTDPQPGQAIPFEILPFEEMPQIKNPPRGFIVNANNDPIGNTLDNDVLNQPRPGGGIFYLNEGRVYQSFRAGRITQMIDNELTLGDGKISFEEIKAMQADTVLLDAQFFVPHILQAFANAAAAGADPSLASLAMDSGVTEAVGRLAAWDFTTPTGTPVGFDGDPNGGDDDDSVAATIYSVWRSRFIANTIDATLGGLPKPGSRQTLRALRHLLEIFDTHGGRGISGVCFFGVDCDLNPQDQKDQRDVVLLQSVRDALDRLASTDFFDSPDQNDYRWGSLHRIVLAHPLDADFSAPPAGGALPAPAGFTGYPVDGGFQTVDAATHSARADSLNAFMFNEGPVRRFAAKMGPKRIRADSSLPGGESGNVFSPIYANLLEPWLLNETHRLLFARKDVKRNADSIERFVPYDEDDDD